MARQKNCWEWILNKFTTTEKKLKDPKQACLTFFVYKCGNVSYCAGASTSNKDHLIDFKGYQILCCKEKAEEAGLKCDVQEQYNDDPVMIITFRKKI